MKYIRKRFVLWTTKHLFNAITEDDVLRTTDSGGIICRGKVLSKEEIEALRSEAEFLRNSVTLKLLLDDMQYVANKTIYEKSTSFDDILFGKAQLFVIDVLKKKIRSLSK